MAKYHEQYPAHLVLLINLFQLSVYAAGLYIMFKLNTITGLLYLVFIVVLELHNMKEGCSNCYYYGKRCAFGKGLIAPWFLKKGDGKVFAEREFTFKDFIPQILVVAIPVIVGIALLISRGFHIWLLIVVLYPVLSWFAANPIIYGKIACPHCKQGKICCPALKFFK